MTKNQRIGAISGSVVLGILIVLSALVVIARTSRVQTAALHFLTERLSRDWGTEIHVGTINYKFPNRLLVRDVLIRDLQQDTLLYVDSLQAKADMWKLISQDTICIRSVVLSGALLNAYKQNDTTMNYRFLVDALRKDKTEEEKKPLLLNLQIQSVRFSRMDVRFNDWKAHIPDARVHLYNYNKDLLDAEIERFSASAIHDSIPLQLEALEAHLVFNDSLLSFPNLHLQMPRSNINVAELHIDRPKENRWVDLPVNDSIGRMQALGRVACRMQVQDATFTPSDIAAIVPQLKTMNGQWTISADVSGQVDSLYAKQLRVNYRGKQLLIGNMTTTGLPFIENLYSRAQCELLTINKATLQDIISSAIGKPIILPDELARLGQIQYQGMLEGPLDSMVLKGAFSTALGGLRTDGRASFSPDFTDIHFNGETSTRRFDIGTFAGQKDLGIIALTARINGHKSPDHPFHGTMYASVDHLEYRGYTYHDVLLDGSFNTTDIEARLHSDDPNLRFRSKASIRLSGRRSYKFALDLDHFRPSELHLTDKYPNADLSLQLRVNMKGKSVDDLCGSIQLTNLLFTHTQDTLTLSELTVQADQTHPFVEGEAVPEKSLSIVSDYLTANIGGTFRWTTLPASVMYFAATTMPSVFPYKQRRQYLKAKHTNHIDFNIRASKLDEVAKKLKLPMLIAGNPAIEGAIDDRRGSIELKANIPGLKTSGEDMENIVLNLQGAHRQLDLALSALHHAGKSATSQQLGDMNLSVGMHAEQDSLMTNFNWTNIDTIHNAGEVLLATRFHRYADKPLIAAHLMPSQLILADSTLHIDDSRITWNAADTIIQIQHFHFGSDFQYAKADGVVSPRTQDTLYAELQNMNLDYYLGALTNVHNAIYFGGTVTGWVRGFSLLSDPKFEAAIEMLHTELNGKEIGDLYAVATLDEQTKHVLIQGEVIDSRLPYSESVIDHRTPGLVLSSDTMPIPLFYTQLSDSIQHHGRHVVHVDGEVGTGGNWGLHIYPDSANVAFINHWCDGIISDMSGYASGCVDVIGSKDANGEPVTAVGVRAMAHNVGITVPYTGVRYFVTDSVIMDATSLQFNHMHVRDAEGHPLDFDGALRHDGNWEDLRYDFVASTDNAMALDLPENNPDMYGGRVYAKARVLIHGDINNCDISVTAKTMRNTNFVFSVGGASSATENTFIEFVDHSPKDTTTEEDIVEYKSSSHFNLDMQIEATPEAQVSVVIDPRTGDRLRGRGEGNIRFNYSDLHGMQMLGTYTLSQGTFGFTFQNVIRREFQIAEGSRVTWSGDVEEPDVDVQAIYRVTASLNDLLGNDAASLTNRSNIPVHCVLHMTDKLFNPILRFGIELPSSDEVVAAQVHSVINTEEMLMRQVLYLLVFNRFYTPEYLRSEASAAAGLNETYSLLSSTITGQINSWLSRLTDAFTLGFNFRTDGQGATASQEYEAQFEIHPIRGLLINGNFGYRYNDISNQPIFGNLDVEYMLTPDGKLRAKAYTHTIDKYSLRQANTVQGVGFVFKHDFNWPTRRAGSASKASRRAKKQPQEN